MTLRVNRTSGVFIHICGNAKPGMCSSSA
ncbi:hypothetical protein A2U01_0116436, partial [Trifolium medium]|nr:hypothetical protein [Trifolium medium]